MADATYSPLVYKNNGGNNLVVASGGSITGETGSKFGFFGATPVVQPASANDAAVGTIAPDLSGWTGSADPTGAQATAILAAIDALKVAPKKLRADLVALGLIKGAA